MTIPKDKLYHLLGGLAVLAWLLAVVWAYQRLGLPSALAVGSLTGPGLELYQKIRKEGTPDPRDAAVTAAPFLIAAAWCAHMGWRWL